MYKEKKEQMSTSKSLKSIILINVKGIFFSLYSKTLFWGVLFIDEIVA